MSATFTKGSLNPCSHVFQVREGGSGFFQILAAFSRVCASVQRHQGGSSCPSPNQQSFLLLHFIKGIF